MRKMMVVFLLIIGLSFSFGSSRALGTEGDYLAIKGARIVPVVGEEIPAGILLIRNGKIEAIGKDVLIPAEAKVIDASGLLAYPGMIDSYCHLGLAEISSIQATIDYRETGRINPQVRATEGLRPDSMHIPIARANGITAALVTPSGGLIAGQSGLVKLVGWTPGEMVIKTPIAMHIELPSLPRAGSRREATPQEEGSKQLEELKGLFNKARYYQKRKEAVRNRLLLPLPQFNETLEFLIPVVNGELPLMISVHTEKDIKAAIAFLQEEKLKGIFFGLSHGEKAAGDIQKAGIPVVLGSLYDMPSSWDEGYDSLFRAPAALHKAGVKIAFSSESASLAKDLPYNAAKAAAFGLDKKEALRAVTINPAQIFGVDHLMGSLEKGKAANIVLADGDILELRTNITHVFIDGKETDMSTRYTELLEKYKKRKVEEDK